MIFFYQSNGFIPNVLTMPSMKIRAYGAILILFFTLVCSLAKYEGLKFWPFMNYPMFSHVNKSNGMIYLKIYSVDSQSQEESEFSKNEYLYPLSYFELARAFAVMMRKDPYMEEIKGVLQTILQNYQKKGGEGISELRLYRLNPVAGRLERVLLVSTK